MFYTILKLFKSCKSGTMAIEYGLIATIICISLITPWQSLADQIAVNFHTVANTLENRQATLDNFYDLTASTQCNGFGSCGSKGNQGVWEGFKRVALENTAFDSLLVDKHSFEVGIFREARKRTRAHMNNTNMKQWHKSVNQDEVKEVTKEVWRELAAEIEAGTLIL